MDLDTYLHTGENTIEVIARNADQPNSRWYSGAGIYRPVKLWTSPKAHIELNGVRIRTVSIDPAVVEVRVSTSVPGTVKVQILDGKKGIACVSGEGTMDITIPDDRLWSVENFL